MGNLFSFFWQIRCGLALQSSPFELENLQSYFKVMDDSTTQIYPWTGQWVGADAIVEYLSGYGGDFSTELAGLSDPVLAWGETTWGTCEVDITGASRFKTKPPYSDGQTCIDFVFGNRIRYSLSGIFFPSVLFTQWDIWTDNGFVAALFGALDTDATTDYICDVLVNSCEEPGITLDQCATSYEALPTFDNSFWIDGNSRGCRMLHAAYARTNPIHCPHVSFDADADDNGLVKCTSSKGLTAEDVFTAQQISTFQSVTLPYETSNLYLAVYPDGNCSAL